MAQNVLEEAAEADAGCPKDEDTEAEDSAVVDCYRFKYCPTSYLDAAGKETSVRHKCYIYSDDGSIYWGLARPSYPKS